MSSEGWETLANHLADNLRELRTKRGLTQNKLAELCGVPRSTIANIETGSGNPTLSVLTRLAAAVQLGLEELLSPPKIDCEVFKKGQLPILRRGGGRVTLHKLLPHATPGMEIDRLELTAGGTMTGSPHKSGTYEYLYCERGTMALWVSGEQHILEAGDLAAFAADQKHSYRNHGKGTAIGFSVVAHALKTAIQ